MIYIATCVGKHHSVSEDAVVAGSEVLTETMEELQMPEAGFICVADGVGGNHGGADASSFVCNHLAAASILKREEIRPFLVKTNERLITKAKENPGLAFMATTLTGVYKLLDSYMLVHIGNTRAYVKQGKYLKQVTADHTTYNWLKSCGQQDAAEASNKNEITNCFGGNNPLLLGKLVVMDCQRFSLMLLTSDGVHEFVDLDTLEAILNGEGLYSDKCNEIIQTAKSAGSEDDMTVVILSRE